MPDDATNETRKPPDNSTWPPGCKVRRSTIERITVTGPVAQSEEIAARLESEGWSDLQSTIKASRITITAEREAPPVNTPADAPPAPKVGDKLRKAREAAGLDRRAFAKAIGMSYSYLSDIEKDRRESLKDQTVYNIAVGIGVSPHTINHRTAQLTEDGIKQARAELGIKEADLEAAREAWKNSRLNKSRIDY